MPNPLQPQPPTAPRRPRRWLGTLIAVAGLAVLAALAWYLTHRPAAAPAAGALPPGGVAPGGPRGGAGFGGGRGGAPPSTVAVVRARRADMPVFIDSLGTVTPMATVTVRPQVSGVLQKVLFNEGQMVTKGQLLAQIDPRPFEMALMQATGSRQRDEAQLAERAPDARALPDAAEAGLDRAPGRRHAGRAGQAARRHGRHRPRQRGHGALNLDYTRIVAPVAGRVGLRAVDVGNLISTSDANGVAVITQLAPIDVRVRDPAGPRARGTCSA